ncbi:MAG: ABC transporter ATP-binding protein [Clostridia bacterium]|nr:ABC transporter ATP-binding protein [Clostridia bacterium]
MFKTIARIIRWCGAQRKKLYIGFVFSFFSTWFAAGPVFVAAYTVGMLLESARSGADFDARWTYFSLIIIAVLVALRFLFDYLRSVFQETICYELVARDRLAIGEALKRVSLGYFQQMDTGSMLNAITTGLNTLENMGIRMVDTFVGGYLNFLCIFLSLAFISPLTALIALAGAALSFLFLLLIGRHSAKFAPRATQAERDLTSATLEYVRGLATVKSFGQDGAALAALSEACAESRKVNLDIEWGYTPSNCLHLLSLKTASVSLTAAAFIMGLAGELSLPLMLMFAFLSFTIFAGLEPISDSAHVLSIINHAMDQLDALREQRTIDKDGRDIALNRFDIAFDHVYFGYGEGDVIKDVSFTLPMGSTTAIVGPSGSGKTTLCNLIARFYDVSGGTVRVGGHDVREFTCDSLLKNISMVFQNV